MSYNIRSLWVRKTTTLASAVGIGLVVFVMASGLMLSAGITKTLVSGGRKDQAIVLRRGADGELSSAFEGRVVNRVAAAPGIKQDSHGPLVTGEMVLAIAVNELGEEEQISNVQIRGVTEDSLRVHPDVHVVSGRLPQPGTDEVMVGKGLVGHFRGMRVGERLELKKDRTVAVVGVFDAAGSSFESEVWGDLDVVRTSFGRAGVVSSVTLRLQSEASFDALKANLENDKTMAVEALRETTYYQRQSNNTSVFVAAMGAITSLFFSVGAIIGAVITMYGAVSQRSREIGTLRALGFSRGSILLSFLLEALAIALLGGVLGIGGALLMSFAKISLMNLASFQVITFGFDPNPSVLLTSVIFGGGMGVLGGLFPAVRAARISPVAALRA